MVYRIGFIFNKSATAAVQCATLYTATPLLGVDRSSSEQISGKIYVHNSELRGVYRETNRISKLIFCQAR